MKIGFIGLGIMGSRMAMNLLKNDNELVVYNRTASKADELIQNGAEWVDSPAEAAKKCEIIITMLSTPDVVQEVAFGENGFLSSMKENSIWINSSTVNPSFASFVNSVCEDKGINYLDAPVAGSLKPAQNGELIFLIGGNKEVFENQVNLFDAMGKKNINCGEAGKGSSMKLVINKLLGEAMLAFAEGMKFGEELGLDKELLLDTLLNSIVVAPMAKMKRTQIETGEFPAEFPLKWLQKDLFLATQTAFELGISLPSGNNAKEVFAMAKEHGLGDNDISAIYKFLKGNK